MAADWGVINTATLWKLSELTPSLLKPQVLHYTMSRWTGQRQETMSAWPSPAWTSSRSSKRKYQVVWDCFFPRYVYQIFAILSPSSMGCVFCDPKEPIRVCTRFRARVLLFNIEIPITQGFPVSTRRQLHFLRYILRMCVSLCIIFIVYVRIRYCCITKQSVSLPPSGNWLAFYTRAAAKS